MKLFLKTFSTYITNFSLHQDFINTLWFYSTGQENCSQPDIITIPIKDSSKVGITSLHKASFNILIFIILSILTFLYSFNLIGAQVRASLMGFGTTVHGILISRSPGNFSFLSSDHFPPLFYKKALGPQQGVKAKTLVLLSIFNLINQPGCCPRQIVGQVSPNICLPSFKISPNWGNQSRLLWDPLMLGDHQGVNMAHWAFGSVLVKSLF